MTFDWQKKKKSTFSFPPLFVPKNGVFIYRPSNKSRLFGCSPFLKKKNDEFCFIFTFPPPPCSHRSFSCTFVCVCVKDLNNKKKNSASSLHPYVQCSWKTKKISDHWLFPPFYGSLIIRSLFVSFFPPLLFRYLFFFHIPCNISHPFLLCVFRSCSSFFRSGKNKIFFRVFFLIIIILFFFLNWTWSTNLT